MHLCSKLGGVLFDISLDFGLPYFGLQRYPGWTNFLYLGKSDLLQFRLPALYLCSVQVTFTLSNIFAIRNPIVKLWKAVFRKEFVRPPSQDGQIPLSSKPGSRLQSTESIQKQLDPESREADATPDTQQLAPTLLV